MAKAPSRERQTSGESLLLDYARRLERFREGRRAVQIHLSRLKPYNRREHHIRIAANTFEALVQQFEGQIFVLANADIVFICKGANLAMIDEAVMRVRYLFSDDPLARDFVADSNGGFCTWYDVEREYPAFLGVAQALHDDEEKRARRLAVIAGPEGSAASERQPLDPARLAELVDAIQRADLSNMMRRQAVCAITPSTAPQPIFQEIYVSIAELRDVVLPGFELVGDRWLFQFLTQTLDQRILKMLVKNDDRAIARSFSLNLNVATMLSQAFLDFDASLRPGARGTIVLEVQLIDAFADLAAFYFARDFAKERGYRVCLDGSTHLTLPYLERERLGVDLVKLSWRPDIADLHQSGRLGELRDAVAALGRTRSILCHCDTAQAIEVGQACGINLFQGRHVDRLLAAASRSAPPPGTPRLAAPG